MATKPAKYRICRRAMAWGAETHRGRAVYLSRKEAELFTAKMNRENPGLKHWPERVEEK